MKTILKWPGGKEKELPVIRNYIPDYTGRFVEPFVGGGAVFFDISHADCCINDKSDELINLYRCIQTQDGDFKQYLQTQADEFAALSAFVDNNRETILKLYHSKIAVDDFISQFSDVFSQLAKDYNPVFIRELHKNLDSKIKRSQKLEAQNGELPDHDRLDNMESALKSAYYMYIRYLQNHPEGVSCGRQAAVFFFIREYCYSSMFRYNAKGEFNVPYGGISYNRKDFQRKIDYLFSDDVRNKLQNASIQNTDFEPFMENLILTPNDFVFFGSAL